MARRRLEVEIVGDAKNLNRTLGQTETRLKRFDRNVSKAKGLSPFTTGAATFGGGLVASAAISQLAKAVGVASNLNEQGARARQIFAGASGEIDRWSKTTASSMGIAADQALEFAGTFGLLFRNVGQSTTEASKFSRSLVQLAADMASFNNTSVEDALLAIRSGLTGEIEPLRRYGVFLSEARTRTQALADTHKRSAADLTTGEKVLARYKLLMQDTVLTQGDFARTSESLANQTRTLAAEWRDLQARVGEFVTPIAEDGVAALLAMADAANVSASAIGRLADRMGSLGTSGDKGRFVPGVGWVDDMVIPGPDESTRARPSASTAGVRPAGSTPLPKITGISTRLQEQIMDARLRGTDEALLKALRSARGSLQQAVKDPRLTQKERMGVKQALLGVIGEITGITDGMAADAETAKQDARDAAEDAARARQEARDKRKRAQDEAKQKREEADRRRQEAIEAAAEAAEEFARKMEERADNLKSAALRALDRIKERRDFGRSMSEALEQLALARRIGSPTAVRNAQDELGDLRLDRARMMLEDAKVTSLAGGQGPRGRLIGGGGFAIHMPGATIVANNPQELAKALQRMARTAPSNRRGPYAGTRTGI